MTEVYTETWEREFFTRRGTWGTGPWDSEADKYVWIDPDTDLDCMVIRNKMGALCGYVGIPPQHPLHGISYSGCVFCGKNEFKGDWRDNLKLFQEGQTPERDCTCVNRVTVEMFFDVHGSLTYANACQKDGKICHEPKPGRPVDVWWFGWDHAHYRDIVPAMEALDQDLGLGLNPYANYEHYYTVPEVTAEVLDAARQFKDYTPPPLLALPSSASE